MECPICYESLENTNICTTKCKHSFCTCCFIKHVCNKSILPKCPLCREDIMDDKLKDTLIEANIKNGDEDTSFDDVALLLSLNEVGANDDAITIIDEEIEEYSEENENVTVRNNILDEEYFAPYDPLDFICDSLNGNNFMSISPIDTNIETEMDIGELSMSNIDMDEASERVSFVIDRMPSVTSFASTTSSFIEIVNQSESIEILDILPDTVTVRN